MRRHLGASRASQNAAPSATDSESAFRLAFGDRLTPTQHTVVRLILRGHSNVSIASHMQITEGTAKLHRYNIYKRLNISSQSELFQLFIEHLG
jgi:DNA-binding CsgD family transcriptional regulator